MLTSIEFTGVFWSISDAVNRLN